MGKKIQFPNYGTKVINKNPSIGDYCRIHVCVNIVTLGGSLKALLIANYVYIASGAKVYGGINITDNIGIVANAAVSKSFLKSNKLIGGVSTKELGDIDISKIIKTY